MPLELITAPLAEPVTRAEAKSFLRVDSDLTEDDALIDLLISAARRYAEHWTGRSFITQTWRLTLDSFPGRMTMGFAPYGQQYSIPGNALVLERGPVKSVDSIIYTDMAGATQTILTPSAPDYAIDLSGHVARIAPGFGRIWPITLPQLGAAKVTFTAGYGPDGASVPQEVRNWILIRVSTAYNSREEVVATRGLQSLPYTDRLLDEVTTVLA